MSVRPGKKEGDPKVSDVCVYRYALNDVGAPQILYKLDWMDDWHELPTRLTQKASVGFHFLLRDWPSQKESFRIYQL